MLFVQCKIADDGSSDQTGECKDVGDRVDVLVCGKRCEYTLRKRWPEMSMSAFVGSPCAALQSRAPTSYTSFSNLWELSDLDHDHTRHQGRDNGSRKSDCAYFFLPLIPCFASSSFPVVYERNKLPRTHRFGDPASLESSILDQDLVRLGASEVNGRLRSLRMGLVRGEAPP